MAAAVYILVAIGDYYPGGFLNDVELATTDEAQAREAFRAVRGRADTVELYRVEGAGLSRWHEGRGAWDAAEWGPAALDPVWTEEHF